MKNQTKINNQVCNCGRHKGIGSWSPFNRARVYKWFQKRYLQGFTADKQNYLYTYEKQHGLITNWEPLETHQT